MTELEGEEFPEAEGLPPVVFQVDTGLSPLQAVQEWAAEGNPPAQRVAYILSIPAAAAESSLDECREVLIPLLSQLAFDDHPDIKQATAEVLGPLGPILASKDPETAGPEGSADCMDLLVLAHRLLQDAERGVQESAASSVAQFAGLLSHQHRHEHLSAIIDALMHNFDDEQMQECAVDLLAKVAAAAGPQHPAWCEECALPRMVKLSMHRDYNIRVHAVSGLVALAGCLPEQERTGGLLSAFADLCADQVWSVRQDCASELAALAARLPRPAVRDRLLPLWAALVGDISAWVLSAARRQAGPLLAGIHPEDATPALMEAFVAAASGPATLTEACAHYLPAVLRNLGKQRWPELREAVDALSCSEYASVRVALAASVHQLAAMLGHEAVATDLLPVIQRLSADEHPAVTDSLAINISSLLAALPPSERLGQLGFLARMHPEDGSSCGQWRMRLLIAEQLAAIAALLEGQGLAEVLLPATLRLCEDPVAAVREAAATQLGSMARGLLAEAAEGGRLSSAASSSSISSRGAESSREEAAASWQDEKPGAGEAASEVCQQDGSAQAALVESMQQLAVSDSVAGVQQAQQEGGQQQAAAAPAAAAEREGATASQQAAEQAAAAQQQGQGEEEEDEDSEVLQQPGGQCAAMVQQIVRHIVELQRSSCHRSRQTYLLFCSALLLPPAAQATPPAPEAALPATGVHEPGRESAASEAAQEVEAADAAADAGALQADAPAWPALSAGVASCGIVQGLLEGALALAADPVPNVRLGVARLLAALRNQQPQLAGSNARVAPALASLAADADRDVQAAAAQ
ncbi:hypothetical protein ABPG75_009734 [Micractinium tetrahymenae]